MITKAELMEWLETIDAESSIAIDNGGLLLVELDGEGEETGAYLEVGGVPYDDEDGDDELDSESSG